VGRPVAAMLLPFSSHARVAGAGRDALHEQQQEGPVFVYSDAFGPSMFWNLDAMWEAAYSRARHDASFDFVLHVNDLACAGRISRTQMRQWVNRQKASSGYTLLHQVHAFRIPMVLSNALILILRKVAWHGYDDGLKGVLLGMGADENIKTLSGETAADVAVRKKMHGL